MEDYKPQTRLENTPDCPRYIQQHVLGDKKKTQQCNKKCIKREQRGPRTNGCRPLAVKRGVAGRVVGFPAWKFTAARKQDSHAVRDKGGKTPLLSLLNR